ncbi:hypothetical protein ASF58_15510 [Methylobacterium sp. Leaf125]|jgi:hypothetical protein|nr:hypothetical protein ASF58_15510 [Methylobacterium sp. Leaf125]
MSECTAGSSRRPRRRDGPDRAVQPKTNVELSRAASIMFRFKTRRPGSNRRPPLSLVLVLCATALLLWWPILALSETAVWFW